MDAMTVEFGFDGEGAFEAPLEIDQMLHQLFFGGAAGAEAEMVVVEQQNEFAGILVEDDVFVAGQAVDDAIAAGSGFAFGGAGAGGFLGIAAVGFDLSFSHKNVLSLAG